jgi:hypothetical protein
MRLLPFAIVAGAVAVVACQAPQAPPQASAADVTAAPPAVAADATAIVAPAPEPSGDIEFKSALDLDQAPAGGEPALRGGEEARSADWPASLYAMFIVPGGGGAACTAALIGPKAMLTAAHCVPATGTVTFSYKGHARPYVTTCTRHPKYSAATRDASADFALCAVAPAFVEPEGFLYETVNTSGMAGLMNQPVVLTGLGCISSTVANVQIDGKYRIGFNTIQETSASPPPHLRNAALYAPQENNNLFTTIDPARGNPCPGDSGGPAFMRTEGGAQLTRRTIVGVNSRVFYRDAARTSYGSSLVSATGGPDFRVWAEQWARHAAVAACGIAGALPNCRH